MSTNPTLALDGEGIPLQNMRITLSMQFQDKDQGGQTSSTAKAEQGVKGKELRVSGLIPFTKPEILKRLFEMGIATGSDGQRKRYRVAHQTARAVGLREVIFTGNIDAPEQDGRMAWIVTFTLTEQMSVPEKREERTASKTAATKQTAAGTGSVSGAAATEDESKMTWFEKKVLKPVNDALE
ncbi:baseplate complex protein [Type-E symbiont of Plautia stali]|uniref:baseplate complex protein n=1 Tax=Type-E symbiont of Plautia stali TaxID=1560357 RepID=UPI00073F0621|nr:hypothetical protein [Type-E symbiont of Plautia stali]